MKPMKTAVLALLVFAAAFPAHAQNGEDLTIKLAVAGPGSELYFWWGHIALVIDNSRTGQSRFYDYGLFSFEKENFLLNFAMGRLLYSSGVSSSESNIAIYKRYDRGVTLYTLDIPPEKREEIRRFADNSVLPENRDYLYHLFKTNCTGSILTILDIATDGQFHEKWSEEPGRFTLRQHVRRHTWFAPFVDWILNFLMGQDIDTPVTVWEEMFLPSEIAKRIQGFEYADSWGAQRTLVRDVDVVFVSESRPIVLDAPFNQWPRELIFSLCLSLALGLLFIIQAKSPAFGQVVLGICHSLFGLVFGIAGLVLFFLSIFTSHDYTYHNINLLFCNPLFLAAIPLGIKYASSPNYNKRLRPELLLRLLWLLTVIGVIISMLLKLTPWFWQDNLTDQMLMLPIALLLALEPKGLRRMLRRLLWRWI